MTKNMDLFSSCIFTAVVKVVVFLLLLLENRCITFYRGSKNRVVK